jgi:hypothetical protein
MFLLTVIIAGCQTAPVKPPQLPDVKVQRSSKYFDLDFSTKCQKVILDTTTCFYCFDTTGDLRRPALMTCDWAKVAEVSK